MLTHRNIVSECAAGTLAGLNLSPSDVHLSYLPLAHIFESMVIINAMFIGGSVGFYHGVIVLFCFVSFRFVSFRFVAGLHFLMVMLLLTPFKIMN
jgi:acyl-CoA synthetase (AMP-forming)/AMP-acid ligase II